jgi:hypothetical protein
MNDDTCWMVLEMLWQALQQAVIHGDLPLNRSESSHVIPQVEGNSDGNGSPYSLLPQATPNSLPTISEYALPC